MKALSASSLVIAALATLTAVSHAQVHDRTKGVRDARAPQHAEFRAGDVRHSQADISKARELLGYDPQFDVKAGLRLAMPWYVAQARCR